MSTVTADWKHLLSSRTQKLSGPAILVVLLNEWEPRDAVDIPLLLSYLSCVSQFFCVHAFSRLFSFPYHLSNMRILPPTQMAAFLVLSVAAHVLFPVRQVLDYPYNYVGALIVLFGSVVALWSRVLFRRNKTTAKPHEKPSELVSSGPFRFSRNPMYLGMTLILFGVAVMLGSLSSFLSPILFVISMEAFYIPQEEENLEKVFGERYLEYRKKTRRWV